MTSRILLLIFVLITGMSAAGIYQKILNTIDTQAKCLDGSPPALYIHEGTTDNILIYMIGGASCSGNTLNQILQNCYQRSLTIYGSSTYWPQTKIGAGILSTDPSKNIFANWTKAILLYCDGAFHQGYAKEPISYKNTKLYFRGSPNTRAHFAYLHSRFNLTNANKVVLSGSSAGGISTYAWIDYLKDYIANPAVKVYSVIDSGIFLDPAQNQLSKDSDGDSDIFYQVTNKDEGVPNQKCAKNLPKQKQFTCLSIQTALPFVQTQSLFLQSAYDQYVIRYGGNIHCLTEGVSGYSLKECQGADLTSIEGYRIFYLNYLKKLTSYGHSIWSISCSWHAVVFFDQFYESALQKVPMESGLTMQQAIYIYVFKDGKVMNIDLDPWPANRPCAY